MTRFSTITAADWRTAIARARSTPNSISEQIHFAMNISQVINTRGAGCSAPQPVSKQPAVFEAVASLEESLAVAHSTLDLLLKKLDPVLPPPNACLKDEVMAPDAYGLAGAIARYSASVRGLTAKAADAVDRIQL